MVMSKNPATFVLVHGAWCGGWCYHKVAAQLRARGHNVFTPTLTGQGERSHLISGNINLSLHIEDILAVFRCENLSDVVLAGHSYGGMVITGVADRLAERIRALVYLDAFCPRTASHCSTSMCRRIRSGFSPMPARSVGSRFRRRPPPSSTSMPTTPPASTRWRRPTPSVASPKRSSSPARTNNIAKRLYVHGTVLPRESPFKPFYDRVKDDPAWQSHALSCGHHVMLDEPEHVVAILQSAL